MSFRLYEDEKVHVEAGRAAHRSRHRRRRGGRLNRPYPEDLKPIGEFGTWLAVRVREEMAVGVVLDDHLVSIAFPLDHVALTFKSIKSHGCHYRVAESNGTNKHVSYDCGIAGLLGYSSKVVGAAHGIRKLWRYNWHMWAL